MLFRSHENGPGYQFKDTPGYDMLIDRGEKLVAGQWMRRYFVRSNASVGTCVEVLAKKRWLRKRKNNDKMDIRNYQALKEMVLALKTKDDIDKAQAREERALRYLREELKAARGGARSTIQIQAKAFAASEVTALV